MNENKAMEIANYRYQLIAPIVSKPNMAYGERAKVIKEIVGGTYKGMDYSRGYVSTRTLERYIEMYAKGGRDALMPSSRGRATRIPEEYLEKAALLRQENPSRSIRMIISMLEMSGKVPANILKYSTVQEYFAKRNISSSAYSKRSNGFTRYGASHRGEILQGDFHHTLYLKDPADKSRKKLVKLHAWIDDFSRLVDGQFYWNEKAPSMEESLKKWIIRYSVPETILVDNGAAYSTNHLKQICGALGIRLSHSTPGRPMSRGKIEKFFRLVESSFKSEAELLINQDKIVDIDQLNNLFSVWLDNFYNKRTHSATKKRPVDRWNSCPHTLRRVPLTEIYEAFLLEEKRSVSKTGIISLSGNEYEVETFLCGKEVTVRYDPYNMSSGIRVFFDGRQFKDAIPAKVHRHAKKGYEREQPDTTPVTSGINFLELLNGEKIKNKQIMTFADDFRKEADDS